MLGLAYFTSPVATIMVLMSQFILSLLYSVIVTEYNILPDTQFNCLGYIALYVGVIAAL